ncbi:MAG: MFS transporter [Planctomycetaceae bacterium]|jgi:MFS family permease|nr:MFS transporter [Planctomycetaceae bacterium]
MKIPLNNYKNFMPKEPSRFYRWELLFLLFCAYFLHQADRAIFGVLLPSIKSELGLSDTQLGLTASVLFLVLAVMVPVAGFLGDRWSKKKIITGSLIFWSVATMLTGFARGLGGLILFRSVATGGGESFYGPASTALIAAYHEKTRAIALSIHQASLYIGIMCSGFLAGYVAELFGWRFAFYLFGSFGILLGFILIFRLRDAPQIGTINEKTISPFQAVLILIRIPTVLLLTVGFTAIVFVNNAYLTWMPTFIKEKFALTQIESGGYAMFYHHLAALIGVLAGGLFADMMVLRFPRFRILLQSVTMLLGTPLIFMIGNVHSLASLWITIFLFGGMRGLYESNTHAAMFDVIPLSLRSTVVGLMIMTAFLFGSFSPLLLGWLGDIYGTEKGLAFGFQILSFTWLLGGCCVFSSFFITFNKDQQKYKP